MALGTIILGSLLGGALVAGALALADPLGVRKPVVVPVEPPEVSPWADLDEIAASLPAESRPILEDEGAGTTPKGVRYAWRIYVPRPMPGKDIVDIFWSSWILYQENGEWIDALAGEPLMSPHRLAPDLEGARADVAAWVAAN